MGFWSKLASLLLDGMKLYRVDVTMNMIFQDPAPVNAYLRILKRDSCFRTINWNSLTRVL